MSQPSPTALEAARLRLARLAVDEKQSLERVFARATRLIARTLDVERVGIWLFDERRTHLACACLYERSTDTHGTGERLVLADLPRYRAALEEHRAIVAHDARSDPRTSELTASYLAPRGIGAMLDAPLFRHGEVAGVVCHEHVGAPRTWTDAEVAFVESVADLVAHTMEQAAHIAARTALEDLTRRAELDRRMAALGRVASAIAHDFGNLLMVVQVRAEQIATDDRVPPRSAAYARIILDTVRRSRDMIRQLAELGRGSEPDGATLGLDDCIAAVSEIVASLAPDGRRVVFHLDAAGARVRLDASMIERILGNLVSNALAASDPGGSVRVETTVDGPYAVLRVTDQGHGIDDATRPHIFEPYFTTRAETGGCGLGLAIVHVAVERAGGFVEVDSAPGRGTSIAVHLPVAPDEPARQQA